MYVGLLLLNNSEKENSKIGTNTEKICKAIEKIENTNTMK
jgi:dihydroxyacetone kinase DhaKLM complex PTS-EIIA-like component DhaM